MLIGMHVLARGEGVREVGELSAAAGDLPEILAPYVGHVRVGRVDGRVVVVPTLAVVVGSNLEQVRSSQLRPARAAVVCTPHTQGPGIHTGPPAQGGVQPARVRVRDGERNAAGAAAWRQAARERGEVGAAVDRLEDAAVRAGVYGCDVHRCRGVRIDCYVGDADVAEADGPVGVAFDRLE